MVLADSVTHLSHFYTWVSARHHQPELLEDAAKLMGRGSGDVWPQGGKAGCLI